MNFATMSIKANKFTTTHNEMISTMCYGVRLTLLMPKLFFFFNLGPCKTLPVKFDPPKSQESLNICSSLLSVAMNKFLFFPNSKTQRASHLHCWFQNNSNFAELVLGLLRTLVMQKLKPDCGES